jgi:phenol/toluene 2-monooxygenase (NADH) P1/A1
VQYELRYQVIEPKRQTFQHLIDRFGDRPASRYEEATIDVQPTENFHYRPTWAPDRELYDPAFSALRLTDAYSFLDPRQYYYTPYVTARAAHHEAFAQTLAYLDDRELLTKLPPAWRDVLTTVVVPLRHYESGAQLLSVAGARFAYGTSIEQCCTFAAFDRIGNAQMLSRVGIAAGGGTAHVLAEAKTAWLDEAHLQPLRRLVEEAMVEPDWATGVLAVDLVDSLLYPTIYRCLDDAALLGGAGAWSLLAQHFDRWYRDQRRWLDALLAAWAADDEHGAANVAQLDAIYSRWLPAAAEAVGALSGAVDALVPEAKAADQVTALAAEVDARGPTAPDGTTTTTATPNGAIR